ncbi:MAG: DUF4321 domain-containing protein [Elusimicrobia bacterium]|nr:DUF4321 domain-containing protein [Nanoarchaeota archaeon]MBU2568283.1 DUF4321 domain-containing protein [Elusimicrobiota bacterium]
MSKNIIFFVLVIIVGALVGSFLGKFIGQVFPADSAIKELFATEISAGLSSTKLDLRIIEFTFGCMINLNVTAVLGMVVAGYLFRMLINK